MQNVTTATVIDFLQSLFVRWVCQVSLLPTMDHSSRRFSLQKNAIQHVRTSCYHPETNGGVERFN